MERVNLELTGLPGSLGPSLSMGWLDDTHLWIHWLSPRIIDIPRGAEFDRDAAARLARARPQLKIEPRRKTAGLFHYEWGLLYFKGDAKPIASVLDEFGAKTSDMEIAPGGEWAAYSKEGLWLVHGRAKRTTRILEGWTYDLRWMGSETN